MGTCFFALTFVLSIKVNLIYFLHSYIYSSPFSYLLSVLGISCLAVVLRIDYLHKRTRKQIIRSIDTPVFLVNRKGIIQKLLNLPAEQEANRLFDNLKGTDVKTITVEAGDYDKHMQTLVEVLHTKNSGSVTIKIRVKNNREIYIFIRMVYFNSDHVMVFMKNITEEEKQRIANQKYQFFLQSILEHLPIAVFVKDRNDHGRYLIWNKKAVEVMDIDSKDIIGTYEKDMPLYQSDKCIEEAENRLVETGFLQTFTHQVQTGKGNRRMLSINKSLVDFNNGEESWVVSSVLDFTDLHAKQMELNKANRHLSFIIKALELISWKWDVVSDEITCDLEYFRANEPLASNIVRMKKEKFLGLILPVYRSRVREAFHSLLSDKKELFAEEYQSRVVAEEIPIWVESFAIVSERDSDGNAISIVGSSRNINDRKRMEQKLRDNKAEEEANKLKISFLNNMTHEIRTPLNAIVGFSNILADFIHDEELKEYVRVIRMNNELLLSLMTNILDFTRIESSTLETTKYKVELNELLREHEASCVEKANPGVEVRFSFAMDQCQICAPSESIMLVMNNFISNACKNTEKGSIEIGYYPVHNKKIKCFVRDTGRGIPADKQEAIFERFVKLDAYQQGTGLGLPICAIIAKKINAQIGLESEPGIGSEFWIEFPYRPITLKCEEEKCSVFVSFT